MAISQTDLHQLLADKKGIKLDIGCGANRQSGWIGIDRRDLPEVDIIHDLEVFPYPLPDDCAHWILASHILEHIKPWLMIDMMNELWRVCMPDGTLFIAMPYAGTARFWQDPTHIHAWNEYTPCYFDPEYKALYQIYEPKPWKIEQNDWTAIGDMNIRFRKLNG